MPQVEYPPNIKNSGYWNSNVSAIQTAMAVVKRSKRRNTQEKKTACTMMLT